MSYFRLHILSAATAVALSLSHSAQAQSLLDLYQSARAYDATYQAAQAQAESKPGTRRLFRLLVVGGFCVIMAAAMRRQRRQTAETGGQR